MPIMLATYSTNKIIVLIVTSVGWQVTLCDLIWHLISRSGVVISITNCYIRFTLLTLLTETIC